MHPLAPAAAAELFAQRAEAVDPDFFVTTANLPIIAEICLRLDCLPLAVELMAARIDLLTPQAMLARLADNRLDLLGDGPDDLPPHQKTLRRAIERSYALLDAYEQQLFRRCGVFAGTFDLAAAEACVPMAQVAERLQSLLAKSLVKTVATEDGERRFVLLETLRAYALEQLLACGETSDQHARARRLLCGAGCTDQPAGRSRAPGVRGSESRSRPCNGSWAATAQQPCRWWRTCAVLVCDRSF